MVGDDVKSQQAYGAGQERERDSGRGQTSCLEGSVLCG